MIKRKFLIFINEICFIIGSTLRCLLFKRTIFKKAVLEGKDVDGDIIIFRKRKYFVHILMGYIHEVR